MGRQVVEVEGSLQFTSGQLQLPADEIARLCRSIKPINNVDSKTADNGRLLVVHIKANSQHVYDSTLKQVESKIAHAVKRFNRKSKPHATEDKAILDFLQS